MGLSSMHRGLRQSPHRRSLGFFGVLSEFALLVCTSGPNRIGRSSICLNADKPLVGGGLKVLVGTSTVVTQPHIALVTANAVRVRTTPVIRIPDSKSKQKPDLVPYRMASTNRTAMAWVYTARRPPFVGPRPTKGGTFPKGPLGVFLTDKGETGVRGIIRDDRGHCSVTWPRRSASLGWRRTRRRARPCYRLRSRGRGGDPEADRYRAAAIDARGVPQQARAVRRGHDAVGLGIPPAAAVPGRYRGRILPFEALLRPRAVQLAWPRAFQGLCALGGVRPTTGCIWFLWAA